MPDQKIVTIPKSSSSAIISPSPLTTDEEKSSNDNSLDNDQRLLTKTQDDDEEEIHPAFQSFNGVPTNKSSTPHHLLHRSRDGQPTLTNVNDQSRGPNKIFNRNRITENMKPNLRWNSFQRNSSYISKPQDYIDQYNEENPDNVALYSNVFSWTRARLILTTPI
jgi:hypothetical protein